ncbi:MAG TPA: SNF2-related protein [Anaerohalosphaeraceae bacterium]|nr:SNF2-related protein [Anaerohalosphaeraceae bacterium]HOL89670.1 SNF2-related protein [Anaerohalosphaeraceae bacterium]HPP54984.1 SNF2-related protein [Anaerohalosphaeraceae bacterium]
MFGVNNKKKKILEKLKRKIEIISLTEIIQQVANIENIKHSQLSINPIINNSPLNFFLTKPIIVKNVEFVLQDKNSIMISFNLKIVNLTEVYLILKCLAIPLSIRININRIDFEKERSELLKNFPYPRIIRTYGGRVSHPRPPKPPGFEEKGLKERLKWILTPPINNILLDPQLYLPERPYRFQSFGVKWLFDREKALLADEMGLGKTMQAIIAARLLWKQKTINQILIICPKTLISNWKIEINKWWPNIEGNIAIVGRDRQFFLRMGMANVIVKIMNYESLARELAWLKDQKFSHDLVIIDEAQRIKNPKSKISQAVKLLKASRRWALTGTPLENKIDDLVSIFDFLVPGLVNNNMQQSTISTKVKPYILRRRVEEVNIDLPEKIEEDVAIDLDPEHFGVYKQMEEEGVVELKEKGESITVTHVFALINRLRQICNFCPTNGFSAKTERLIEDLEEIVENKRKVLVFSQFVSEEYGIKRIAKELEKKNFRALQLHGEYSPRKRDDVKEEFLNDNLVACLLLNYTIGGVGLNLQKANYVYLFDRWWNPAVEDQAIKRAHRIGQTQKVFVRKFYCKNTIEERILRKLSEKRCLFRQVIDENKIEESMGLSEEEIFSLFNLKIKPKGQEKKEALISLIFDNLSPQQFENLIANIYEKQGYNIRITAGSHDMGIDILAEKLTGAARDKVVIQCKHQKANVGRPVVQQFWGIVSSDQSITRGDFVTSSDFTSEAKEFASGKRITLIGREEIIKLARNLNIAILE